LDPVFLGPEDWGAQECLGFQKTGEKEREREAREDSSEEKSVIRGEDEVEKGTKRLSWERPTTRRHG